MSNIDGRDTQLRHQISNLSIGDDSEAKKFSEIDFNVSEPTSNMKNAEINAGESSTNVTSHEGLRNDFVDNFGEALGLSTTSFDTLSENEKDLIKLILLEAAEIALANDTGDDGGDGVVTVKQILESAVEVLERYDDDDTDTEGRQTKDAGDTEHDTTLMRDKQLRDDLTVRIAENRGDDDNPIKSGTRRGWSRDQGPPNLTRSVVKPEEFLASPPDPNEGVRRGHVGGQTNLDNNDFYNVVHHNFKDVLGFPKGHRDHETNEVIYALTAEAIEIIDAKALKDGEDPDYSYKNVLDTINNDILERYDGDNNYGDTGVTSSNDLNFQNMFEPIDSGTAVHLGLEALGLSFETELTAPTNYTNGDTTISSENLTQLKYGVTPEGDDSLNQLSEEFDAAYGEQLGFGTPPTSQQEALRDNILLEAAEKAKEADPNRDFEARPLTVEEILAQVPAVINDAPDAGVEILDVGGKISKEIGGNTAGQYAYANISRMFGNVSGQDEHGNDIIEPLTTDQAKAFFNQIREEINSQSSAASFTDTQLNYVIDLLGGEDGNIDFHDFHHIMNYVEFRTGQDLMTGHGVKGSTYSVGDNSPDKTQFVSTLSNDHKAVFTLDPHTNQPTKIDLFRPNEVDSYKTHTKGGTDPVDTDPVNTDPVDTDPVDTDPVDTDPALTEAGAIEVANEADITFDTGTKTTFDDSTKTLSGTANGVHTTITFSDDDEIESTTYKYGDTEDATTVVQDATGGVTVTTPGGKEITFDANATVTANDEGKLTIAGTVGGVDKTIVLSGSGDIESTTYKYGDNNTKVVQDATGGVTVTTPGGKEITFDANATVTANDEGKLTIAGTVGAGTVGTNENATTVDADGTVTTTGHLGTVVYNPNGTSTLTSEDGDNSISIEMDKKGETESTTYKYGDTTVVQDATGGVTVTTPGGKEITFDANATVTANDEGKLTIAGTVGGVDTTIVLSGSGDIESTTYTAGNTTVVQDATGVTITPSGNDAVPITFHANATVTPNGDSTLTISGNFKRNEVTMVSPLDSDTHPAGSYMNNKTYTVDADGIVTNVTPEIDSATGDLTIAPGKSAELKGGIIVSQEEEGDDITLTYGDVTSPYPSGTTINVQSFGDKSQVITVTEPPADGETEEKTTRIITSPDGSITETKSDGTVVRKVSDATTAEAVEPKHYDPTDAPPLDPSIQTAADSFVALGGDVTVNNFSTDGQVSYGTTTETRISRDVLEHDISEKLTEDQETKLAASGFTLTEIIDAVTGPGNPDVTFDQYQDILALVEVASKHDFEEVDTGRIETDIDGTELGAHGFGRITRGAGEKITFENNSLNDKDANNALYISGTNDKPFKTIKDEIDAITPDDGKRSVDDVITWLSTTADGAVAPNYPYPLGDEGKAVITAIAGSDGTKEVSDDELEAILAYLSADGLQSFTGVDRHTTREDNTYSIEDFGDITIDREIDPSDGITVTGGSITITPESESTPQNPVVYVSAKAAEEEAAEPEVAVPEKMFESRGYFNDALKDNTQDLTAQQILDSALKYYDNDNDKMLDLQETTELLTNIFGSDAVMSGYVNDLVGPDGKLSATKLEDLLTIHTYMAHENANEADKDTVPNPLGIRDIKESVKIGGEFEENLLPGDTNIITLTLPGTGSVITLTQTGTVSGSEFSGSYDSGGIGNGDEPRDFDLEDPNFMQFIKDFLKLLGLDEGIINGLIDRDSTGS